MRGWISTVSVTLICSNLAGVSPVTLDGLVVPPVIQNGTLEHVVLDCPYTLGPGEREGVVLKWYLNSRTVPIYQWIPPSHPQGLGSLRHKLNLDHEVTADPYSRHRALYIREPGVEMSGEYTCKVSTLENEVTRSSTMVVYTPPRRLEVSTVRASYSSVNISCLVDHTFPRPALTLYRRGARVAGVRRAAERYEDGAWRVAVSAVMEDAALQLENLFECELFLPQTDFRLSKSTIYTPRQPAVLARSNTFSSSPTPAPSSTSFLFIILIHSLTLTLARE